MCLICVAPKGTEKYSKFFIDSIRSGAISNTQGMGYSYKKAGNDKEVFISKGYFSIKNLLNSLEEADLQLDDELMVHMRIGTSGKTDDLNCHPFVISTKQDEILTLEGWVSKPTLAHNGIFGEYAYKNSVYSDTYHFVHEFMNNKHLLEFFKEDTEEFDMVFDNIGFLGWNKIVILFPDKGLVCSQGFIEDSGYFFSNKGYCNSSIRNVGGVEDKVVLSTFNPIVPKEEEHKAKKEETNNSNLILPNNEIEDDSEDEEEGKGLLDGMKNALGRFFNKKENSVALPLKIAITEYNYNQILLVTNIAFNKFKKGDIVEVMSFKTRFEIYVKKIKENVDLILLSEYDIRTNFDIFAKETYARKFSEYKRMVTEIPNPTKSFLKKIEKKSARCKKNRMELVPFGFFDRDAIIEYKHQTEAGISFIKVKEDLVT